MAKRRKYKSSKSTKCPEPLNALIDIAGAAAMGAYTRHKIIKDYERGQGEASVKAAMLVHGAGAMRRGSDGLVSLGGVYGIKSALKAIEKKERAAIEESVRLEERRMEPLVEPLKKTHTNNNKYAWRLNCEDGTLFGISPNDYETREEYHLAIQKATGELLCCQDDNRPCADEQPEETVQSIPEFCFCRVSRLDDGKNAYYLAREEYSIGTQVLVPYDSGEAIGIVLTVEYHSLQTAPVDPGCTEFILNKVML